MIKEMKTLIKSKASGIAAGISTANEKD